MIVIEAGEERTTTTAAGVMTGLAAPSQGSTELSTWRVLMEGGAEGPVHTIDREQVWMPLIGVFAVAAEGQTVTVAAGMAVVLPAHVERQVRAQEGPAEALVCMRAGGTATVPGGLEPRRLPWAD